MSDKYIRTERQIHKCAVSLEKKTFDRLRRDYIWGSLRKNEVVTELPQYIKTLYKNTKSSHQKEWKKKFIWKTI